MEVVMDSTVAIGKADKPVIAQLKGEARRLHNAATKGEPAALARLGLTTPPLEGELKRRHCLAAIAKQLGFAGWPHLVAIIEGSRRDDFGTLLYPLGGAAHTNIWSAHYEEAKRLREETNGYLLAYKRQFFIVDEHFLVTLGLDPTDPDWQRIGCNRVEPIDAHARDRLYDKIIAARLNA